METKLSKVTVDSIGESLKDGLKQAQIRQTVTRSLPKAKVHNDLEDSLYTTEELGIGTNDYEEVRVGWVEVAKTATKEQVQADLDKFPKATLRRILASEPILDEDQKRVYQNGLTGAALDSFNTKYGIEAGTPWGEDHQKFFLNNIVDRQVVRYGEGNKDGKPADEVVLYNNKQQFRRVVFSKDGKPDIDVRIKQEEIVKFEDIAMAPTANANVEVQA